MGPSWRGWLAWAVGCTNGFGMQVVNLHNISFEHNLWAEVCARWPFGWVGGCKGAGWARARWPVGWAGGSSNVGTKGKTNVEGKKCGGKTNVEEKKIGL